MATTPFPVNPELTAIAIGYRNTEDSLIADDVLPRVPVPKKFQWTKYDQAQGYTVPDTKIGRKSEPTMVDFGGTLIRGEMVALYQDWMAAGWVQGGQAQKDFEAHVAVEIDATNAYQADIVLPPELINGLRVIAAQIQPTL